MPPPRPPCMKSYSSIQREQHEGVMQIWIIPLVTVDMFHQEMLQALQQSITTVLHLQHNLIVSHL